MYMYMYTHMYMHMYIYTRQRWFATECPPIFQFSTLRQNARQLFNLAFCDGMLDNLSI